MYNEELKMRFITENYPNEKTQQTLIYLFRKVSQIEEQFNTDVCKTSVPQLEETLRNIDSSKVSSLEKDYSYISTYYKWAYSQGICPRNMAFNTVRSKDCEFYVNSAAFKSQYFKNREEMYSLCNKIENYVDKAIIVLLYEGLCGESMSEISNLKAKNDGSDECVYVDFKKRDIIIRKGFKRIIDNIDARSMNIIREAIDEKEYYNDNGKSEAKAPVRYLVESDYVIRPTIKGNNAGNKPISADALGSKLERIKKWTEESNLNPKNIHFSGMFEQLMKREEKGELIGADYKFVLTRYGKNINLYGQLKQRYERFKRALEEEI